jgi:hypothetical protein
LTSIRFSSIGRIKLLHLARIVGRECRRSDISFNLAHEWRCRRESGRLHAHNPSAVRAMANSDSFVNRQFNNERICHV